MKSYKHMEWTRSYEPRFLEIDVDGLTVYCQRYDTGQWQAFIEDASCPGGVHFSWPCKYPYQAIKEVINLRRNFVKGTSMKTISAGDLVILTRNIPREEHFQPNYDTIWEGQEGLVIEASLGGKGEVTYLLEINTDLYIRVKRNEIFKIDDSPPDGNTPAIRIRKGDLYG